jgi:pyruvate dehydrogenase E2 component (dihydrolipoamide acetyltransferase)
MKTVEMPKMGDSMEEGKILRWIKKEGDPVKKGEMLAEVETDKVNIEIEAFASGVLRKIMVPEGTVAPIGAKIALIGAPDESLPANLTSFPTLQTQASSEQQAQVPAALDNASIGGTPTAVNQGRIFISPLARRVAAENNLDYATLQGTGPNGRIIKNDIEAALNRQPAALSIPASARVAEPIPPLATQPVPEPVPGLAASTSSDEVIELPLTAMRRTIARRLSQSMQTAPHFYVTAVIDTGKLATFRQQINDYTASDAAPVKVSFNDLIVKAVAKALVRMPQVNVSFAEDRLLQKKQIHIGVAVALEQGLIVPVLRNADRRGLLDIARETQRLAEAARQGKIRPEEFSGGTFTVSNLGMFDVDSFTAVINQPESAILAVGSITPTPAVVDGQVVVRNRMKVTLSSDHRAIDGATAARFLQEVKRLLEEPFGLVL